MMKVLSIVLLALSVSTSSFAQTAPERTVKHKYSKHKTVKHTVAKRQTPPAADTMKIKEQKRAGVKRMLKEKTRFSDTSKHK